jgi:hypothetical protein
MDSPYRITNQGMLNILRTVLMCNKEKTVGEIFVVATGKQHPFHVEDGELVRMFEKLIADTNDRRLTDQGLRHNDEVDLLMSLFTSYWAQYPDLSLCKLMSQLIYRYDIFNFEHVSDEMLLACFPETHEALSA